MSRYTNLTSRLLIQLRRARKKADRYLRSPEIEDIAYQQRYGRNPYLQAAQKLEAELAKFKPVTAKQIIARHANDLGVELGKNGLPLDKGDTDALAKLIKEEALKLESKKKSSFAGAKPLGRLSNLNPVAEAVAQRENILGQQRLYAKSLRVVAKETTEELQKAGFAGKPFKGTEREVRKILAGAFDRATGKVSLPASVTQAYEPGMLGHVMVAGTKSTRPIAAIPLIGKALRHPVGYGLAATFAPALIGAAVRGFRKATSPTGGVDAEALLAQREQMLEFQRQQAKRQALKGQIASNMLRIQQLMPHKYLELLAGRPLAQGTFMIGAPPRPELVEQLAADLATGQLTAGSSMLDMMPMMPNGGMPGGGMPGGGMMAGGPFGGMMR